MVAAPSKVSFARDVNIGPCSPRHNVDAYCIFNSECRLAVHTAGHAWIFTYLQRHTV